MFIAILGRQPDISMAELESVFTKPNVKLVRGEIATIASSSIDLSILGGSTKVAKVITHVPSTSKKDSDRFLEASKQITDHYLKKWRDHPGKITLGISAYGFQVSPRSVQKTGLILKSALKKHGVSLRLIPNNDNVLPTAVSHNNKLGLSDNKVELLVVKTDDSILLAESLGAQNITAYARRDHGKPKRDAFVGMLPPKLAQIMLNLALGPTLEASAESSQVTVLDPFCGTGTVLQEAALRGFSVYGTDLSEKMIAYSRDNLNWLQEAYRLRTDWYLHPADATKATWRQPITHIVCETYLGQPFSAPPSPQKLREVVGNCNHIISQFLANIHPQLQQNTPLCIAVPAWRDKDGRLTHLPLIKQLNALGYTLSREPLIYSRPDQVVAREILVLKTSR